MVDEERRTRLPDAVAEGAGNFAAEPAADPSAGPKQDEEISRLEQGEESRSIDEPVYHFESTDELGQDPAEQLEAQTADLPEE
ncbi:MAG: hypothetical protein M3281_02315 [Chloroflexota bacterium]|nr:hypothetical protein [Chloroflexota bacterium]